MDRFSHLEINGGRVSANRSGDGYRLRLPASPQGYADAQIDDYGVRGDVFRWRPGTRLILEARFSADVTSLQGTAGFGFWNAPFGPGTGRLPSLPQAVWFFFGSAPTDLPLAPAPHPGRGWFVATIDSGTARALRWAPLAPLVLLLNRLPLVRDRLWSRIQRDLGISFAKIDVDMRNWHQYQLDWREKGSFFRVDGVTVLATKARPRGALGFVCWIDNQFLRLSETGGIGWGTLETDAPQWLDVERLSLDQLP